MQIVANEKTQRGILAQGLHRNIQELFLDMWLNDLNTATSSEAELIGYANAILIYFKSPLRALSVDWDDDNNCFIWLLERN